MSLALAIAVVWPLWRARAEGPSPYTLPWQLRSVMVGNTVRLDSAEAFYKDTNGNSGGVASASMLTGAYKLTSDLALLARVGLVGNAPPAGASGATSFVNPLVGGLYSLGLPNDLRLAFFLGFTLPVGTGGGNSPNPAVAAANSAGVLARSGMDNALFAVNYFTMTPGVDLAWVSNGFTAQLEATLLQLTRVRGSLADKDASRTNFTSGLGLGYSISDLFSVDAELRYQRWLDNGTVFGFANPPVGNLSLAFGPRLAFETGGIAIKPGIAYAQGLAGPIASGDFTYPTNSDRIVFIDIPMSF